MLPVNQLFGAVFSPPGWLRICRIRRESEKALSSLLGKVIVGQDGLLLREQIGALPFLDLQETVPTLNIHPCESAKAQRLGGGVSPNARRNSPSGL
jgi:hypothetical protein